MDEYIDKIAVPQVKEILTNYGRSPCSGGTRPGHDPRSAPKSLQAALEDCSPDIIMNNRLGGGYKGDTETPEQHIPPPAIPGRDWETCMTINDTWGYKSYDQNWKSY